MIIIIDCFVLYMLHAMKLQQCTHTHTHKIHCRSFICTTYPGLETAHVSNRLEYKPWWDTPYRTDRDSLAMLYSSLYQCYSYIESKL